MKQKKILLLGGSAQQVVAIKTAKEMGYYTVLCDYLPDNPGQYEADKFYQESTTDVEAVYRIAKENEVDGILAYASDPAALPAAIVCERLGLPTNPVKSVEILGVKHRFRDFLRDNGFACPKAYSFNPNDEKESIKDAVKDFTFPLVVKPTDSSGSKGITKIEDFSNLTAAIKHADEYSRNKILLIEEFIQRGYPNVIGGDVFVWNGRVVLHGEMECLRGEGGKGLIPIGKKKPLGCNSKQISNIHNEVQRLVEKLGIQFGELNVEILLDGDDNVHFLELGPRAGGNMIPIQLSDAFGVNLVKANIASALGEDPQVEINEQSGCYYTYVLHSYEDGIFRGVDYDPTIAPCIYRQVIYKKDGDSVEAFDGAGKALGIIFLHTDTFEQMEELSSKMEELVRIKL